MFFVAGRFGQKKTLVISDSMLRGVRIGTRQDTDLISKGGAKIRDLSASIYYYADRERARGIKVAGYQTILIHVGTNDLSNGRSALEISLDIKELLDVIRRDNRDAVLIVSAILYRPVDDFTSYRKVNVVNAEVDRVCNRFRSTLFIRTHSVFKSGNTLLAQLYDAHGLHLNRAGLDRLGTYLRARLSRGCLRRDFALARRPLPRYLR